MAELGNDDIRKVANLARLKLSDAEIRHFAEQLDGVLSYVHVLDELDVSNVRPMAHAVDVSNVLRGRHAHRACLATSTGERSQNRWPLLPGAADSGKRLTGE